MRDVGKISIEPVRNRLAVSFLAHDSVMKLTMRSDMKSAIKSAKRMREVKFHVIQWGLEVVAR